MYCWFIHTEFIAKSTITHAWTKLTEHTYFLPKAPHSLLVLRTLDSTSALLTLRTILKSKITNKNHKKVKNMALSKWWKEYLFKLWELKYTGRMLLYSASMRLKFFNTAHVQALEWPAKAIWVLILRLQINLACR